MSALHVRLNGEERGPYTIAQLRAMWNAGTITADAEVRADANKWRPAAELLDPPSEAVQRASTSHASEPESKKPASAKPWTLLLTVPVLVVLIVGNFHVVTGSDAGMRVVHRDSSSFSEFFVDADAITGMPWIAARSRYPLGCKVLQREGLIESDSEFQERMRRKAEEDAKEFQRKWDGSH
jgi:hypothetical protein